MPRAPGTDPGWGARPASSAATEAVLARDLSPAEHKLAAAIVASAAESHAQQGVKVLPMQVVACSAERAGPGDKDFIQRVELQTNYDFSRISKLSVDATKKQEVRSVAQPPQPAFHAVPVILQPGNCEGIRLIFAHFYRMRLPTSQWVLVNSTGQQTALTSSPLLAEQAHRASAGGLVGFRHQSPRTCRDELQGTCASLNANTSCQEVVQPLHGKDWQGVLRMALSAGELRRHVDGLPAMDVSTPFGHLSLQAIWARLALQERCECLSFIGNGFREVALGTHRAWVDLVRRTSLTELLDGTSDLTLLRSLEFVPDRTDPEGPVAGVTFGPDLLLGDSIWSIVRHAQPEWGSQGRVLLPLKQWASLLEPPPASRAALEAALAGLLEQRFLWLAADIQGAVGQGAATDAAEVQLDNSGDASESECGGAARGAAPASAGAGCRPGGAVCSRAACGREAPPPFPVRGGEVHPDGTRAASESECSCGSDTPSLAEKEAGARGADAAGCCRSTAGPCDARSSRDASPTASTRSAAESDSDNASDAKQRLFHWRGVSAWLPSSCMGEALYERLAPMNGEWHVMYATVQNTFLNFATLSPAVESVEEPLTRRRRARSLDTVVWTELRA